MCNWCTIMCALVSPIVVGFLGGVYKYDFDFNCNELFTPRGVTISAVPAIIAVAATLEYNTSSNRI